MKNKILCLMFGVLFSAMAGTASAATIIAIDLDSTTAEIQDALTVALNDALNISVVAYDDGTGIPDLITSVIADVTSSDSTVAVLGTAATTAGSFAGIPFLSGLIIDAGSFGATAPGATLTPVFPTTPGPGTTGSVGYFDLFGIGSALPVSATGMTFVDLFNFTAVAGAVGMSTLNISANPLASGFVGLNPVSQGGTITAAAATGVPEPGTLLLLSVGLLALTGMRAKHSPAQRVNSVG